MTGTEIKALLADMTLKEKIGQLTQLDASCFNDEGPGKTAENVYGKTTTSYSCIIYGGYYQWI